MSIGSAYDDILEDIECPNCHHIGMLPDGDLNYICPECEFEGTLEDDYDDILEDIECPNCHHIGMLPDDDLNYICPECEFKGTLEDD